MYGLPVMAHGADHALNGMQMVATNRPSITFTQQCLERMGMSSQTARFYDSSINQLFALYGGVSLARGAFGAVMGGGQNTVAYAGYSLSSAPSMGAAAFNGEQIITNIVQPFSGAENINASINLAKKLSQIVDAQHSATNIRFLRDGRIRYYGVEKLASTQGATRGRSYVTELDVNTGRVRTWMECYNHSGLVNRVHPKQINGQEVLGPHYPPTAKDLREYE